MAILSTTNGCGAYPPHDTVTLTHFVDSSRKQVIGYVSYQDYFKNPGWEVDWDVPLHAIFEGSKISSIIRTRKVYT
jgi:hypothetical protein